jgi:hypothetical protein
VGEPEWWSLSALNDEVPDHHHDSTVDNLATIYYASDNLRCFQKEHVPAAEIDSCHLFDDPEDADGDFKIESIRTTIRTGIPLPAIVMIHFSGHEGTPYHVLEGRHRYNACYREQVPRVYAWVAHLGCCGGPTPDLSVEDPFADGASCRMPRQ